MNKKICKGNDSYEPSNTTKIVTVKEVVKTKVKSTYGNVDKYYNAEDYLSSEELKARHPEMSDMELFEKYGERGSGGITYDGRTVAEIRRENPDAMNY